MLKPMARSALGKEFGAVSLIGTVHQVAVSERSDIAAVLISVALDDCAPCVSSIVGIDLPSTPGRFVSGAGRTAIWLSPRSWILQCTVEDETRLQDAVAAQFPDGSVHATSFTDQLCWLELSGGDPLELLQKGAFVSLEPTGLQVGQSKRTIVADAAVVVLCLDSAGLLVGVERSRARYFRDWLLSTPHGDGMSASSERQ